MSLKVILLLHIKAIKTQSKAPSPTAQLQDDLISHAFTIPH